MRFTVPLPDGSEVEVNMTLPIPTIQKGPLPTPTAMGQAMAAHLTPHFVDRIKPGLPPASPAHKEIERNEQGQIVGMTDHPAMPSPTVVAGWITRQLEPVLAAYYERATRIAYDKIAAAKQPAPATVETREPTL